MCFSLQWLESFLVWLVIVCAVVALIRLLIGFIIPKLGVGAEVASVVVRALWIVMWAIICVALIYFIFDLIMCLGPSLPRMR